MDIKAMQDMKNCIEASGMFDFDYYRNLYSDVIGNEEDLIMHYIKYGANLGFDPAPFFDTSYYIHQVDGLKESDLNPLFHYIMYGIDECRAPNDFDAKETREVHDLYFQWCQEHEKIKKSKWKLKYYARIILKSGEFDYEYYENLSGISREEKHEQILHYLEEGMYHNLNPNREFKIQYYINSYAVNNEIEVPFVHYIKYGRKSGYRCQDFVQAEQNEREYKRLRQLYDKKINEEKQNCAFWGALEPVKGVAELNAIRGIKKNSHWKSDLEIYLILDWKDQGEVQSLMNEIEQQQYPFAVKIIGSMQEMRDVSDAAYVWKPGKAEMKKILHILNHCILCAGEEVMAMILAHSDRCYWDVLPGYQMSNKKIVSSAIVSENCLVRWGIVKDLSDEAEFERQVIKGVDGSKVARVFIPDVNDFPGQEKKLEADKKHFMISVYEFSYGGGEIMPIRLANQLKKMGYPVMVHALNRTEDKKVRKMLNPVIPVVRTNDKTEMADILKWYQIDVINTHHQTNQSFIADILKTNPHLRENVRHVATSHGMYDAFSNEKLSKILKDLYGGVDFWTYVADKNLEPFQKERIFDSAQFKKIPNGIEKPAIKQIHRESLGISENAFVFCLASRAIKEKGWEEAIEAIDRARAKTGKDIQLILIGDGPVYQKLNSETRKEFVHLLGFKDNPCDYYAISDAMILLSYYRSESAPLSIIEALQCGIPVVASDIGDIRQMLTCEKGMAGKVLKLENGMIHIDKASGVIEKMVCDREFYKQCKEYAHIKAKEFDIKEIAEQYIKVFEISK